MARCAARVAECGCPPVAPEDRSWDVEFARNPSGTVHVLRWHDPYAEHEPVKLDPAEAMLSMIRHREQALCGRTVMVTGAEDAADRARWAVRVSEFPDEQLCAACVAAMGDQSPRAFEHPQTDEEDDR